MIVPQATFLRNRAYLAAAASHFFIDVLNNGRVLLVAILAVRLELSNAQVGLFLLLYNFGGSLSQPLFGWLADRFGARWLAVGGMGWMIFFYTLAAMAGDWAALAALTVASLGSGAFHPSGTKVASQSSTTRRTQATAFFFMAGQMGLFVGPILAGPLLDTFDRPGYLALTLLTLVAFAGSWRWLTDDVRELATVREADSPQDEGRLSLSVQRVLLLIVIIIFAYNTVSFVAINFAPKLFTEWGHSATYVGWIAGLYMMGSAVGGLVGGTLADRIGGKPVILGAMLGMILPIYFYIPAGDVARFPILLVAGFFGGMPHSILVLTVQSLFPGRRALASGLALGLMFVSGALGSFFLGIIADQIGLAEALQGIAVLPLVAAGAALLLPRRRGRPAVQSPA